MYYIFGYDEERPEGTLSHGYSKIVQSIAEIENLREGLEKKTGAKIYFRILSSDDDIEIPKAYLTRRHIGRNNIKPSGESVKINVEQLKTRANESNNS